MTLWTRTARYEEPTRTSTGQVGQILFTAFWKYDLVLLWSKVANWLMTKKCRKANANFISIILVFCLLDISVGQERKVLYILSVARRQLLPGGFWLLLIMWCFFEKITQISHYILSIPGLQLQADVHAQHPPRVLSTAGFIRLEKTQRRKGVGGGGWEWVSSAKITTVSDTSFSQVLIFDWLRWQMKRRLSLGKEGVFKRVCVLMSSRQLLVFASSRLHWRCRAIVDVCDYIKGQILTI